MRPVDISGVVIRKLREPVRRLRPGRCESCLAETDAFGEMRVAQTIHARAVRYARCCGSWYCLARLGGVIITEQPSKLAACRIGEVRAMALDDGYEAMLADNSQAVRSYRLEVRRRSDPDA